MKQFVYSFNEGSGEMRSLLGTKGAALAEMMQSGLPVPFGFTVTTEAFLRCCHGVLLSNFFDFITIK